VFPSAGVAMTHGDDPYDETGFVTPYPGFPGPEPLENLVTIDEYNNQIFPPGQSYDACIASTGVQPGNIAIKYGSDYVMNLYCQDLASSATHANGQVYAFMSYYYSLQTLESMGLWTTLDNKQAALNWCATH
jgi:hypothetical protein